MDGGADRSLERRARALFVCATAHRRAGITCMVNVTFFCADPSYHAGRRAILSVDTAAYAGSCDVLRLATGLWQARPCCDEGAAVSAADAAARDAVIPVRLIARLDIKGPNVVRAASGSRGCASSANRATSPGATTIRVRTKYCSSIVASLYGRNNILGCRPGARREIFIPTNGGGIFTLEAIGAALAPGADKVAINTAGIRRPALLRRGG